MERKYCTSYLPHEKNAYTKNKPHAFISHCSLTKMQMKRSSNTNQKLLKIHKSSNNKLKIHRKKGFFFTKLQMGSDKTQVNWLVSVNSSPKISHL
jgi:hypothetical protein